MPRILIFSVLALCSCGAASTGEEILFSMCEPLQVVPADDASEAEVNSISTAIELWSAVGVNNLTTTSIDGGAQVPVLFAVTTPLYRGVYEPRYGVVSVNRVLEGSERDVTIAHELGHALGLLHVPLKERQSVMNPGNLTVLPSPEDEAVLQQLWRCPANP